MGKMLYFQFYPMDWFRDTRRLSPIARSAWIDILCLAWNEPERGIYQRTPDAMMRELGIFKDDFDAVLKELSGVADVVRVPKCDIDVTSMSRECPEQIRIVSRKMRKMELNLEYERNRKRINRGRAKSQKCPGDVPMEKLRSREAKKLIKVNTNTADTDTRISADPDFMKPVIHSSSSTVPDLVSQVIAAKAGHARGKVLRSVSEPVRRLLHVYKRLQDDKTPEDKWDRIFFKRYADDAEELLEIFGDDYKIAAICLSDLATDFRAKDLHWTISTIIRHAGEWKVKHAESIPTAAR